MKYIIFDFDGTLADSTDVLMKAWNTVADQYGFKKVSKAELHSLKSLSAQQRAKKFDFPMYKLPMILPKIYRYMKEHIHEVKLFDGIKEMLTTLAQKGYPILILSSNSKENIELLLQQEQIDSVSQVLTSSKLFGKDAVIKKVMNQHGLTPNQFIYVGDEVRDIVACKKVNVPVVWVNWGIDGYEVVKQEKPDYVVHTPGELVDLL